jgi:xanthine dehydrogenase small subunit
LRGSAGKREVPLDHFFLGYKKIDLREGESIEAILIPAAGRPAEAENGETVHDGRFFSFEKASKRANLDIASVNSALVCALERGGNHGSGRGVLHGVRLSAGGVGPTPLFLEEASAFLEGKAIDAATVRKAAELAVAACAPQSDVRGSASYRSALVKRFVYAHFLRMAPDSGLAEELFP